MSNYNAYKKRQAEIERKNKEYSAEIQKQLILRGLRWTDLGEALGMSGPTISKRIKHPETQTITEMRRICSILDIPQELYITFI